LTRESWKPLNPIEAAVLSDARRQVHHAAQLATAFGISYLEKQPDDSHTSLEWIEPDGALASHEQNGVSVALRISDLTLLIGDATFEMLGRTILEAADWTRAQLESAGFDGSRFTLEKHFEIPTHPVADGAIFDAKAHELHELSNWYSSAVPQLEKICAQNRGASDVRCWPHHFDIATLISLDNGKTVGAGMEPGDIYYEEPYFYVNANPPPWGRELPQTLKGHGAWHTQQWIGAVLPASRLTTDVTSQEEQVTDYFWSAVQACKALLTH
jgi:hypothetical protein